jgi:hypothetical protein
MYFCNFLIKQSKACASPKSFIVLKRIIQLKGILGVERLTSKHEAQYRQKTKKIVSVMQRVYGEIVAF